MWNFFIIQSAAFITTTLMESASNSHNPGGATPPGTLGGSFSTISPERPNSSMSEALRWTSVGSVLVTVPSAATRNLLLRPIVMIDSGKVAADENGVVEKADCFRPIVASEEEGVIDRVVLGLIAEWQWVFTVKAGVGDDFEAGFRWHGADVVDSVTSRREFAGD